MRAFSWWSYLFAQVGGRLRPEPFWIAEGAEGLRLRVPGLRLPFCVRWGKVSRVAARLRPCQTPHRAYPQPTPAAGCLARTSFPGPQLTVDAHDGGAQGRFPAVGLAVVLEG